MNRILVNGLHATLQGAGISRYTYELMKAFVEGDYPVDLLMRKEIVEHEKWQNLEGKVNIIQADAEMASGMKRILEEQWHQRRRYKAYELVHFTDYSTPLFYRGNKVTTIHDMAMHTMSDKYTMMQNLTKKSLLTYTVKTAEHFICDSEFSKRELLYYYPSLQAKATVIPLGVSEPEIEVNEEQCRQILSKFKVSKPYLLCVGTIAPHKNIKRLIQAFAKVKRQYPDYQLVIAGKKGWMYDEIFEEVHKLSLEKDVIFTGFTDEIELEVLYKKAEFMVCVSLYEGFGLPPLEAMIRNKCVLLSDIEVFRETCGESTLYCHPEQVEDIAEKIKLLMDTPQLRSKLTELGRENIKRFTWKQVAQRTFEIYEKILE